MCADTSFRRCRYQVALSFAGEDRGYVELVARELKHRGVSVFYDHYEQASLWGKNLYDHLTRVYRDEAQFTILFVSEAYAKKLWTNRERESAQSRALEESREYILPARFDDTALPGLLDTTGYVDLRNMAPEQLADLIEQKLRYASAQALGSAQQRGAVGDSAVIGASVDRTEPACDAPASPPDPLVAAALDQVANYSDIHSALCDAILASEHAPSGLLDLLLLAVQQPHARCTFAKFAVECIDKFNICYEAVQSCLAPGGLAADELGRLGLSMRRVSRPPVIDWAHEKLTKQICSDVVYYYFLETHRDFVLSHHCPSMAAYLLVPDRGPAGLNVDSLFLIAEAVQAPQPYVRRLGEWIESGLFDGRSRTASGEQAEVLYAKLNRVHELRHDHPLRKLIQLTCWRVCSLLQSPTEKVVGLYHLYAMREKHFMDVQLVVDDVCGIGVQHMSEDERELFGILMHPRIFPDEDPMWTVAIPLANRVGIFG